MKKINILLQGKTLLWLFFFFCFAFLLPVAHADRSSSVKTLNDVFKEVKVLKSYVEIIRDCCKVNEEWPEVPKQHYKYLRHVLQKSVEVLEKINRLRIIKHAGPITIPHYPLRDITPDEVYDLIERLLDETKLALKIIYDKKVEQVVEFGEIEGKTTNDVYQELWNISYALDSALGIRGFSPNDVYAQTVRIVGEVNYLRLTQNLPLNIEKPLITNGRHPNHALAAVYKFLKKIAQSELNLGMVPIDTFNIPRRVIKPAEVYDALQIVLAELQRIKYRIGFEKHFITPPVVCNKTPDDVIQDISWAEKLMPDFMLNGNLILNRQVSHDKTINHVFSATAHIFNELNQYRMVLRVKPHQWYSLQALNLQPKTVYQKILECMEKVNALRLHIELGPIVVPELPFRPITLNEIYDLVIRMDNEFKIIYKSAGIEEIYDFETLLPFIGIYNDKGLDDVYINLQQISLMLDGVLSGS